jgi:hypothetical protein
MKFFAWPTAKRSALALLALEYVRVRAMLWGPQPALRALRSRVPSIQPRIACILNFKS